MNGKKAKQLRKAVKHGFGNVDASYDITNEHYKAYGIDPITQEPDLALVYTLKLSDDCGRKAYKTLKNKYKRDK